MDKNRFKQLLESTMGNVKPLIMEQVTGDTQNKVTWDSFKERVQNGINTYDYWTFYPRNWGYDPVIQTFKYPQMKYSGYKFVGTYPEGDVEDGIEKFSAYATKIDGDNIIFKTRLGNNEYEVTITKK